MASTFTCFRPNPILSSNHRKPDLTRRNATNPSSSWWTPLFGWSSDPDYITKSVAAIDEDVIDPADSRARSRFAPGCFTEEKARELRKKTTEAATFHDIMYHSAIASRLASDVSER